MSLRCVWPLELLDVRREAQCSGLRERERSRYYILNKERNELKEQKKITEMRCATVTEVAEKASSIASLSSRESKSTQARDRERERERER